ncbi:MAG: hypothetical protein KatS3mg108_3856 [Isosphaeraceae bacterium]|jgi:phospholipase/carboxylesterase|nr:MAG: hypothetical protein KatS3mg108_3856 [Isosphaeraceae bacterium]
MSGDRRPLTTAAEPRTGALAEARFIPRRYEPNYPYPLLVLFHGRGGDEHQLAAAMPALSGRNYVGLSLRGPEVVRRKGREVGFGWGQLFARSESRSPRSVSPGSACETVRKILAGEPSDEVDRLEDGVFDAIRAARRSLHIHSERIFLLGVGEGAAVAYRLGLSYPERFAGVVAINGWLPRLGFAPLARLRSCRRLKLLVAHGEWNGRTPVTDARREVALLRAGGLRVAFQSYPCGHRLTRPMLADVDSWLMRQCTAESA